ncbi:hypothetical protein [Terrabacter sp. 2YAF2]|uniref:hypothetical protein n=1 Tax=Terrabacter sp. 2YAF2 TaxID=3233026 RepID=UPI003F952BB8
MTSSIGRLRMLTRRRHGLHDAGRLWVRRIRSPRNDRVRCERLVEQLVGLHDHLLLHDEQRCRGSADVDAHDVLDPVAAGGARPSTDVRGTSTETGAIRLKGA